MLHNKNIILFALLNMIIPCNSWCAESPQPIDEDLVNFYAEPIEFKLAKALVFQLNLPFPSDNHPAAEILAGHITFDETINMNLLLCCLNKFSLSTSLHISNTTLTQIPETIGMLTNITILDLHQNSLTNLTHYVGHLKKLTLLNLSDNALSILPSTLKRLHNLEELNLSNNQFRTLPCWILKLHKLKSLNLAGNPSELFADENALSIIRELARRPTVKVLLA